MIEQFRRGENHVHRSVAGEHLLIALRHTTDRPLFAMTETAAVVWGRLADWSSLDDLAVALEQQFEIDASSASADVQSFLEQLESVGALERRTVSQ